MTYSRVNVNVICRRTPADNEPNKLDKNDSSSSLADQRDFAALAQEILDGKTNGNLIPF